MNGKEICTKQECERTISKIYCFEGIRKSISDSEEYLCCEIVFATVTCRILNLISSDSVKFAHVNSHFDFLL